MQFVGNRPTSETGTEECQVRIFFGVFTHHLLPQARFNLQTSFVASITKQVPEGDLCGRTWREVQHIEVGRLLIDNGLREANFHL